MSPLGTLHLYTEINANTVTKHHVKPGLINTRLKKNIVKQHAYAPLKNLHTNQRTPRRCLLSHARIRIYVH